MQEKEYEIRYVLFKSKDGNYLKVKQGNKVIIYINEEKEGR